LLTSQATTVIERHPRSDRWDDEETRAAETAAFKPLTREEAQALRAKHPPLSPWRVVGVQAVVGGVAALLALLFTGREEIGWSALYGAATVVLPGALMARGMTSRISRLSPAVGAVSFMLWETVKVVVSIAMLVMAPKLVQPLSWLALLLGAALCIKVYWLALLWRGRAGRS
jgi:ATP synthase protein I